MYVWMVGWSWLCYGSSIRFFQGVPDMKYGVDVYIGGTVPQWKNMMFGDMTEYTLVYSGTYNLWVTPTQFQMPTLINITFTVGVNTPFTLAATNTSDSIVPLLLTDALFNPPFNQSVMRIINIAPAIDSPVSVMINSQYLVNNLAYQDITQYLLLPSIPASALQVFINGTSFWQSSLTASPNNCYSLFVVGQSPNFKGIIKLDF